MSSCDHRKGSQIPLGDKPKQRRSTVLKERRRLTVGLSPGHTGRVVGGTGGRGFGPHVPQGHGPVPAGAPPRRPPRPSVGPLVQRHPVGTPGPAAHLRARLVGRVDAVPHGPPHSFFP